MLGLLLEQADLGLSADEADVELRLMHDDEGADDGNDGRGDPGPFDAADRVEDEPIERHEGDQVDHQAHHDERRVGHLDAGRFAQGCPGGVGRGAEIVPRADAARVLRRLVLRGDFLLAELIELRNLVRLVLTLPRSDRRYRRPDRGRSTAGWS